MYTMSHIYWLVKIYYITLEVSFYIIEDIRYSVIDKINYVNIKVNSKVNFSFVNIDMFTLMYTFSIDYLLY